LWQRYGAWSLDAALLGSVATLLAWPRLQLAWRALGAAAKALVSDAGQLLADGLMSGTSLPDFARSLLHDPRLQAAAAGVQHAAWQLAWPWLLAYALLAAPWHIAGECSRWQGSPGKRAAGLVVTDLAGRPVTLLRAMLRHVAGLLSWLTLNLGHALALLPPDKRALHDYIAGTRVVRDARRARMPGWVAAWITLQVVAAVALVAWLLLRYVAALQAGIPGL
jgi:uncharacterized RDD family membrane protein YckC